MKTKTKLMWLGAALLSASLCGRAEAGVGNPSYLNIDVTVTSNLSVSVSTVRVSSQSAGTWNGTPGAFIQAAATATITNDSGYISERWGLTTPANAFDSGSGSPTWAIGTNSGVDTVEVQATLGGAASTDAQCVASQSWNGGVIAPALTNATLTEYTSTQLVDTSMAAATPDVPATNRMNAGSSRALCWRLTMPQSTSFTGIEVVPIIVTAF